MNISNITYNNFNIGNIPGTSAAPPQSPSRQNEVVPQNELFPSQPATENSPQGQSPAQTGTENSSNQTTSENSEQANTPNQEARPNQTRTVNGRELSQEELRVLEQLKQTDAEVRRHEMAHVAAGGRYITSGANFTYQRGPDGRNYAVGGEVGIDTTAVPGDPQATLQKMRQVRNAALAPANPSAQDLKVAANASAAASKAMSELMVMQAEDQARQNQTQAFGNIHDASSQHKRSNHLATFKPKLTNFQRMWRQKTRSSEINQTSPVREKAVFRVGLNNPFLRKVVILFSKASKSLTSRQ